MVILPFPNLTYNYVTCILLENILFLKRSLHCNIINNKASTPSLLNCEPVINNQK